MPTGHGYAIFGLQRSAPKTTTAAEPLPSFEIEHEAIRPQDPEIEYRVLEDSTDVFPDEPTLVTPPSLPRPEAPPAFGGAGARPRRHDALPPPPFPYQPLPPLPPAAVSTPIGRDAGRAVGFSRTLPVPAPRRRSVMRVLKGAALFAGSFVVAFGIAWASERSTVEKSLPVQLAVDAVAAAPAQEAAPEPVAAVQDETARAVDEAPVAAPEAPAAAPEERAAAPEAPAPVSKPKKPRPAAAAAAAPATPPQPAAAAPPRRPAAEPAPARPAPAPEKPVARTPPPKPAKAEPARGSGPVLWAGDPELKKP